MLNQRLITQAANLVYHLDRRLDQHLAARGRGSELDRLIDLSFWAEVRYQRRLAKFAARQAEEAHPNPLRRH